MAIAVIVCYFGKLPWYFDYFVHSCRFNSTIDFFVFADDSTYTGCVPENVKITITSLDEISKIASDALGFTVKIKSPYKLCDFKPAYGVIFSGILKSYDFWICADIDVIYGNIRTFLTDDFLNNFDLISVRPDWTPGCFVPFRNTPELNTLYTNSKDYKQVFLSDSHFCFDETNFAHEDFTNKVPYQEISTEVESMMHVIKRMEEIKKIKVFYDLFIIEGTPGRLKWCNGTLTYKNKYEILLYHLIYLKAIFTPKARAKVLPRTFHISPTRIYLSKSSK